MSVEIRVEDKALLAALDSLDPKDGNKALLTGARAATKFLKPLVKAAAPRGASGKLRKSVYMGTAKRQKPGSFVGVREKVAFYRHMVIGGTKAHSTAKRGGHVGIQRWEVGGDVRYGPAHEVRGTPPRPFVSATADHYGNQALQIAEAAIAKALNL